MSGTGINGKQEKLITAMLDSGSLCEAARRSGVAESTARRWMASPTMREAYDTRRRALAEAALGALQSGMAAAVAKLRALMDDPGGGASVQCRAALGILEHGVKTLETLDMEARIAALEEAVASQQPQGGRRYA